MYYDVGDSKLVAMKILPQGKQDSGNLAPVAVFDARAGRPDGQGGGSFIETGDAIHEIEPSNQNQRTLKKGGDQPSTSPWQATQQKSEN
jgi:hypothetical protein